MTAVMKSKVRFLSVAFLFSSIAVLAEPQGHKLLFEHVKEMLSDTDKQEIFLALGYLVTPDGKGLASKYCGKVAFETSIVDLNGDGAPEVFILSGNTCTSGSTGVSIDLFVRDSAGKYRKQLGFPAAGYIVLKERNKGYPDLMFGGPGFCRPVWRWS